MAAQIGSNSRINLALVMEYERLDALKPDPRNPLDHPRQQINQIKRSMYEFGCIQPILAQDDGTIICGHAMFEAAKLLELAEVPVIRIRHLTKDQIRAFQIADNRLTQNAKWNRRLLGEALLDLELAGMDLTLTGFDIAEADLAIAALNLDGSEEDETPPAPGPLVARPGDRWEVLGHRILCGDSLLESSYAALMGKELAAMTVADVPYNLSIPGLVGRGKIKHENFAMASGEMTEAEFTDFLITAFTRIAAVSAPGALAYIFIDWRHLFEVTVAGRRAFDSLRALCVWTKTTPGQGAFYRSQHELVPVWVAKAGKPRNNIQQGRFGRNRSNVWSCASPAAFGHAGEEGKLLEAHPTPKPPQLIADAILDCTARGELVLDPFLGGGASLVACERTGRRCRAIELEPKYVDASLRRIRQLTGEDPRRVGDGRLFSELEREAEGE